MLEFWNEALPGGKVCTNICPSVQNSPAAWGLGSKKKTLKSSCPKLVLLSLEETFYKTIPWMA